MAEIGDAAQTVFRDHYGFVPGLFRAQSAVPHIVEAEAALAEAILFQDTGVTRKEKELIVLAEAAAQGNAYCVALGFQTLTLLGVPRQRLFSLIADPNQIELPPTLESCLSLAWADFLCALERGLGVPPDFAPPPIPTHRDRTMLGHRIYTSKLVAPTGTPALDFLREQFSQVLDLFRLQASHPRVLEAEANLMAAVRAPAALPEQQSIAAEAFAQFLHTLQVTLAPELDFPAPAVVPENSSNLLLAESRLTEEHEPVDSDLEIVEAVRGGNIDAFEQLIERHSRRVYRTLVGILGDPEDARDAMQDTFLKAFQHLAKFQARSKFSTWLVSIATNTGIQRLRDRKPFESLDESRADVEEVFRPRHVRTWTEDPEQLYSQVERRQLVESSVRKLPAKYRVVVLLRDLELLSTEEAAAALGLEVSALKSRLLRGRLMLREALAPHFAKESSEVAQ